MTLGSDGVVNGSLTEESTAESAATMARLAPAEVPPTAILEGSIEPNSGGLEHTHLNASTESLTAAGNGCSGARR